MSRSLQLTKEGADTPERLKTLQAEIDAGRSRGRTAASSISDPASTWTSMMRPC